MTSSIIFEKFPELVVTVANQKRDEPFLHGSREKTAKFQRILHAALNACQVAPEDLQKVNLFSDRWVQIITKDQKTYEYDVQPNYFKKIWFKIQRILQKLGLCTLSEETKAYMALAEDFRELWQDVSKWNQQRTVGTQLAATPIEIATQTESASSMEVCVRTYRTTMAIFVGLFTTISLVVQWGYWIYRGVTNYMGAETNDHAAIEESERAIVEKIGACIQRDEALLGVVEYSANLEKLIAMPLIPVRQTCHRSPEIPHSPAFFTGSFPTRDHVSWAVSERKSIFQEMNAAFKRIKLAQYRRACNRSPEMPLSVQISPAFFTGSFPTRDYVFFDAFAYQSFYRSFYAVFQKLTQQRYFGYWNASEGKLLIKNRKGQILSSSEVQKQLSKPLVTSVPSENTAWSPLQNIGGYTTHAKAVTKIFFQSVTRLLALGVISSSSDEYVLQ